MLIKKNSVLKNNHGMLTVDFLFSMVMAALLCVMFFALTTTFSVVEVSQYIAFSVARAYSVAHVSPDAQRQMGLNKFAELTNNNRAIAPLIKNGWYSLVPEGTKYSDDSAVEFRGGNAMNQQSPVFDGYPPTSDIRMPATGIRLKFTAKVLNMNLSFLGSTKRDDDYSAYITGFLIREPTQQECQEWMSEQNRYEAILNLDPNGRFRNITGGNTNAYVPMEDNGC